MDITSPTLSSAQRLNGKVAIITGGSSGFGKAAAKLFVQHGAKVTIADVQDEQGILGDPNLSILESTNDNFKKVFETNVYGGFLGAKHAARVMIPKSSGVILFTASVMSMVVSKTSHAYTMSKHAIIGLMKNLCVEMGQYGIRVNAISPSAVSTPLMKNSMVGLDMKTIEEVIAEANVLKGYHQVL